MVANEIPIKAMEAEMQSSDSCPNHGQLDKPDMLRGDSTKLKVRN